MKPLFENLPNYADISQLHLFDGAIANKNRIYLIGRIHKDNTKDSKIKKRVLVYQRDAAAENQLKVITTLSGYTAIQSEMSYSSQEQYIVYDPRGNKHVFNVEGMSDESDEMYGGIVKSRAIDGKKYSAASMRTIYYRDEQGQQQELGAKQTYHDYETYDRPFDEDSEVDVMAIIGEDGFNDVDGFDAEHIYAVGGKGDVWRYVKGIWTRCGFPSNTTLKRVCCGGDGNVYVSGVEGMTFVGREDSWTALKNPQLSLPFEDMVWYDGKVWATNDYGTWWITPKGITEAKIPYEVKACSRSLYTNAGMLLIVGMGGAALLENGEWQVLCNYEFIP